MMSPEIRQYFKRRLIWDIAIILTSYLVFWLILIGALVATGHASTIRPKDTGTWIDSRPMTHVVQDTSFNCMPAAFAMESQSIGLSLSQDTLASQFQTVETYPGGTLWDNAFPVMNSYASPNATYDARYSANSTQLMQEIEYEVNAFGAAVVMPVVYGKLPWVNNSDTTGHMVVVYGYNTTLSELHVWDPKPDNGLETATAQSLWNASQFEGVVFEVNQMELPEGQG